MDKLIVANWKMNPGIERDALDLAKKSDRARIVICPPFPYLIPISKILKRAALGAQDAFWENGGAFTGEVAPEMLCEAGCEYVILGHSERRRDSKETDEVISKKVLAALKSHLIVILCVGEGLSVRRKGLDAVKKFIKQQLIKDLKGVPLGNLIIAYEPVWAIGTGKADSPRDSWEIISYIRSVLNSKFKMQNSKLLYGGSVNAKNASGFLEVSDGLLVGSASLKPKEFLKIYAQS